MNAEVLLSLTSMSGATASKFVDPGKEGASFVAEQGFV